MLLKDKRHQKLLAIFFNNFLFLNEKKSKIIISHTFPMNNGHIFQQLCNKPLPPLEDTGHHSTLF